MFKWVKNFFKGLFSTKSSQEIAVKAAVSSGLRGKPIAARKVSAIMSACIGFMTTGAIVSPTTIDAIVDAQIAKYNMTPEERLLMGVIMGNAKEQLSTMPDTAYASSEHVEQMKTVFTWIKDTAIAYS